MGCVLSCTHLYPNTATRTRQKHSKTYTTITTNCDIFNKIATFQKTLKDWNMLDENCVSGEDIADFKTQILD